MFGISSFADLFMEGKQSKLSELLSFGAEQSMDVFFLTGSF